MKKKSPAARGKASKTAAHYKNRSLSAEKRVRDLLSRMTLEEKAAQMMCVWQQKPQTLVDANGDFDLKKAQAAFKSGVGLGQVGRPSDAGTGKNAREMALLPYSVRQVQQRTKGRGRDRRDADLQLETDVTPTEGDELETTEGEFGAVGDDGVELGGGENGADENGANESGDGEALADVSEGGDAE